jgi:hypothetical protein
MPLPDAGLNRFALAWYVGAMGALPRVIVVEDGDRYDVLDVIEASETLVRARAPFLFEIGEQLTLRIERDGEVRETRARVRAHVGDDRVTELELLAESSH